jgi:hypothetical protein
VVVMPPVAIDPSTTEDRRQELESPEAPFALNDNEPWLHLPSQSHASVLLNGTAEAALAVDEADDPTARFLAFPADCPHQTNCHRT